MPDPIHLLPTDQTPEEIARSVFRAGDRDKARRAIIQAFRERKPKADWPESLGALPFYRELLAEESPLLDFPSKIDKYRVIQSWLLNAGEVDS